MARPKIDPHRGTIKRLVRDRGFGFIADSQGNEYFFHRSAVVDDQYDRLQEGTAVTFEPGNGPKGPRADAVAPA